MFCTKEDSGVQGHKVSSAYLFLKIKENGQNLFCVF